MKTELALDELARQRVITKTSPRDGCVEKKIELNVLVGQYAKQEEILSNEAWRRVNQRAYELVTEAFGNVE